MRPVERSELLDYQTYDERRPEIRERVLRAKKPRRIHLGEHLTFLFENRDTVRYQVQEMMRAERLVKEAEILHELATYNELLGGPGELGCSLLIEIDDPKLRDEKLRAWRTLPEHLYVVLEGGKKSRAKFDPRQVGEDRLSSVQYLKFDTGKKAPIAIGVDHPALAAEVELTSEQRAALAADLAEG